MAATTPRLRPGAVLYEVPDGTWRCHTGGSFLRVNAPAADLRVLQRLLHGAGSHVEVALRGDRRASPGDGLEDLLAAFRDQGLLAHEEDDRPHAGPPPHPASMPDGAVRRGSPRRSPRVHVEGDTPVAGLLSGRLAGLATLTRGPVTASALEGLDVLVSCAGWLTDRRWQDLDRRCDRAGVAWHMTYAEGETLVAGPCALPGTGPRYHDTRARRLAASPFPDELSWLWQALDASGAAGTPPPPLPPPPLPPPPQPCPGAHEAIADLLLADVRAVLGGQPPPGVGVQTVLDIRTGSASRHHVRPLPDLAAPTW